MKDSTIIQFIFSILNDNENKIILGSEEYYKLKTTLSEIFEYDENGSFDNCLSPFFSSENPLTNYQAQVNFMDEFSTISIVQLTYKMPLAIMNFNSNAIEKFKNILDAVKLTQSLIK